LQRGIESVNIQQEGALWIQMAGTKHFCCKPINRLQGKPVAATMMYDVPIASCLTIVLQ
jgi:hypothetical protein